MISQSMHFADCVGISGVIKGRRARHLPRAPRFGGPPRVVNACRFLYFLWKKVIIHSYNVLQSRSWASSQLYFQRLPLNFAGSLLCLQRDPTATAIWRWSVFKGAPTATEMHKCSIFELHWRAPYRICSV